MDFLVVSGVAALAFAGASFLFRKKKTGTGN
jgi:LPXTG-motif cell wall-anchored protein